MTEKTSKAMLLCQIPLVVSVPGSVQRMREAGIDVFDDLIDHGYDSESDPRKRVSMVADQLDKLCHQWDAAILRKKYWDRLLINRELMLDRINNLRKTQQRKFTEWLQERYSNRCP
jgi:hypothetical protein